jgi:hypothetical protein
VILKLDVGVVSRSGGVQRIPPSHKVPPLMKAMQIVAVRLIMSSGKSSMDRHAARSDAK